MQNNLVSSSLSNQTQNSQKQSLYKSSLRFNQNSFDGNIMIRQKFPISFKKQIWDEISLYTPNRFLFKQNQLLKLLLNNDQKFLSYFKLFYNNHLRIYEWYVLASEKHTQIKEYVFSKLLKKSLPEYKLQLKKNMAEKNKNSLKKDKIIRNSKFLQMSTNNSPKKDPFQSAKAVKLPNSFHQDSISIHSNIRPSQDYHQLFVRTLDACEGQKYIHYDFTKHQKGYESRSLYNNFIRIKKNLKQNPLSFHQTLNGFKSIKQNSQQKSSNVPFSVLETNNRNSFTHQSSFSKFQMTSFWDQNNLTNSKNKRKVLKSKTSKNLVLKKMPHQFGKQKPFTAFVIKTQKSSTHNEINRRILPPEIVDI